MSTTVLAYVILSACAVPVARNSIAIEKTPPTSSRLEGSSFRGRELSFISTSGEQASSSCDYNIEHKLHEAKLWCVEKQCGLQQPTVFQRDRVQQYAYIRQRRKLLCTYSTE